MLGTGASPQVTTANFTLTLLVMVVIGGAGTKYGALLGGFLYTLLDQRLGALAGSSQVQDLPTIIRKPLSEPLFILGSLFILLVFFVPGGLAGIGTRVRGLRRLPARRRRAMKIAWERHGAGPPLLLIQGLGYARWGWEPVVEPLARSFDVILFDNRGIGESDAPAGSLHGRADGRRRAPGARRGRGRARARGRDEPRRDGRAGARAAHARADRQARPRVYDARRAGVRSRCPSRP